MTDDLTDNPTFMDIYTELASVIQDVMPEIIMLLRGEPIPKIGSVEEWIQFDFLSNYPIASQTKRKFDDWCNFQVTCYSMHSEYRVDHKFSRPYELASIYKPAINRKNYPIKNTCIKFYDATMQYLDLRSSGDFSKEIYQNNPSLQVHSTVLTSRARIS